MDPREDSHWKNKARATPTDQQKTFICERCDKAFSSKLIAAHQLWHLNQDEKAEKEAKLKKAKPKKPKIPYQCEYCDKSFHLKRELTIHTLIHTGEKLYRCEQCDYAAARAENLRRHKISKHKQSDDTSTTFIISSEIESVKKDDIQTILKLRKDGQVDGRSSIARAEFQGEL